MNTVDFRDGQCSGTVYDSDGRLYRLSIKAYGTFISANPLHPDVFPGVRRMEAEVVQMTLRLFHAPLPPRAPAKDASTSDASAQGAGDMTDADAEEESALAVPCGTMTSGGTESILLACKAYRDWAKHTRGITSPNMVIPISAHAAFDKAGDYFGIEVIHVPVEDDSRRVNLDLMRRSWTRDTIMVGDMRWGQQDG